MRTMAEERAGQLFLDSHMWSAEFLTRNNTKVAAKHLKNDMSVNRETAVMAAEPMKRNLTAVWNRWLKVGLGFLSGTAEPQL